MQQTNANMVSKALRDKVLAKLDNATITSKEVNTLIEEIGGIVVSLQTLYFAEILKLEKRMTGMIEELNESYSDYLEELREGFADKKQTINVNVNTPHLDPESIVKVLTQSFKQGPFSKI